MSLSTMQYHSPMQYHHHLHLPHRKPSPSFVPRYPSFSAPACRKPTFVVSAATTTPIDDRTCRADATMYELLAVKETAGQEEIKAAYRRQARRWHPDACRSSEEKAYFAERFMRAREAYLVLSDPALREDYDHSLQIGLAGVPSCGIRFRKGKARASGVGGGGERLVFGDWKSQLEVLKRRSSYRDDGPSSSWGSRMRCANSS